MMDGNGTTYGVVPTLFTVTIWSEYGDYDGDGWRTDFEWRLGEEEVNLRGSPPDAAVIASALGISGTHAECCEAIAEHFRVVDRCTCFAAPYCLVHYRH
jgi:hypothetical protein